MHDIPHTTDLHQSCACHAKWTWRSPKRCACHKKCKSSSENHATALCLSQRMTFDMLWNMLECHEVPCLPHETTLRTAFAALPIARPEGPRCGRAANGCGHNSSVEKTQVHPQTPKVKWEPIATHSGKNISLHCHPPAPRKHQTGTGSRGREKHPHLWVQSCCDIIEDAGADIFSYQCFVHSPRQGQACLLTTTQGASRDLPGRPLLRGPEQGDPSKMGIVRKHRG